MLKTGRIIAQTVGELLHYFWKQKMWWMVPMVIVLVLFGLLIYFAQSSPLAPFIYPLF